MKKILFLMAGLCMFSLIMMAQQKPATLSKAILNRNLPSFTVLDNGISPTQPGNVVVNSKAVLDDIIGGSRYDMQTNASVQNNRLVMWPDGNLSATWTMGFADAAYSDRGTGYNYKNSSAWGPAPTTRIETMKSGWPSVHPWMGNGEMILAHNSTKFMPMNTRPVKGTGAWTQNLRLTAPGNAFGLVWPRTITSGPNHQYIHVLVVTTPVANGGTVYQGLDGALVYYRSLDGGATWDKQGIILPQLTSADYYGFSGDDYTWAQPHGDTLVFVNGGQWTDTFMMKSTDNGNTWTKTTILPNYYSKNNGTTVTPAFICCDGSVACEMDKNGVTHVAFGRMRAVCTGSAHNYYPGTDGIVYWNSTMPVLDTAIVTDIDNCLAHNILLGYVAANAAGDSILDPFPHYGVSLSSFPQIIVDDYNNLYFLWSSLTVGNPSPDPLNYRHIWGRAWFHGSASWNNMVDLNDGVFYMFQEYVYPSVASSLKNDKIQLITQTSSQPGANIKDATIPIHDVYIEYREIPVSAFGTPPVNNPTLTISTLQNVAAGPVTVPVHATNFNNLGAFQFTLEYNPALMTFTGTSNWYPGITDVLIGTATQGKITFIWAASSQGVNLIDGNFFDLDFTWLGSTETSPVSWEDSPTPREFSDYNGLILTPSYTDGWVAGTTAVNHFTTVWTGNPLYPMSIAVTQAQFDATNLVAGDEIGIFDGNLCVGAYKLTAPINPGNPPFIVVSKDDPATPAVDGYTEGNLIIYKLWKAATSQQVDNVTHTFPYAPLFVFETFTQNETAVVALTGISTITQNIPLINGWNMISFNTLPADPNLLNLLQPLVTSGNLIKVIDEEGNIIQNFPWGWVNNIGEMAFTEGYYIKVAAPCTLSVTGAPAPSPATIPLISGWNIMGYPCQNEQNALTALQPLITAGILVKVIDEAGNIIQNFPWGWVNNIGNLKAGEGYYIKVAAACSLTLNNPSTKQMAAKSVTMDLPVHFMRPGQGNPYQPMALAISISPEALESMEDGDEIGVFDGDICTGAFVVDKQGSSNPVFTAYADDPLTIGIDGFTDGNPVSFRCWNKTTNLETAIEVNFTSGDAVFTQLGTYVGDLANTLTGLSSTSRSHTYLGNNRPNPFNGVTEIEYQLADQAHVLLKVFTPNGIEVSELVNSLQEKGRHTVKFNAQSLPAGVYYYQLLATFGSEQYLETKKMIIVR